VNQEGWKRVSASCICSADSVEIAGKPAIAQTKMTISQASAVHDVQVDVLCTGRFYDSLRSRLALGHRLRRLFYEKDRMDPVDPSAPLKLIQNSGAIPEATKHLAYLHPASIQGQDGYAGLNGPDADALRRGEKMARGWATLSGGPTFAHGAEQASPLWADLANKLTLNPHRLVPIVGSRARLGEGRDTSIVIKLLAPS